MAHVAGAKCRKMLRKGHWKRTAYYCPAMADHEVYALVEGQELNHGFYCEKHAKDAAAPERWSEPVSVRKVL